MYILSYRDEFRAPLAELVYAADLKSATARFVGSSPTGGTILTSDLISPRFLFSAKVGECFNSVLRVFGQCLVSVWNVCLIFLFFLFGVGINKPATGISVTGGIFFLEVDFDIVTRFEMVDDARFFHGCIL